MENNTHADNVRVALMLRMLRAALGMTQMDLAHWIDIPRVTITRAESLERPLKANLLIRIIRMAGEAGVNITMGDIPRVELTDSFMDSEYTRNGVNKDA